MPALSRRILSAVLVAGCLMPLAAWAQGSGSSATNPALPDTLQNLANRGAQIRYLGREKGLDGWIAVNQGQEQYFYATPDREAVLMGLLFDKNGRMLTIRQVQNLQQGNDPTLESLLIEDNAAAAEDPLAALQKQLLQQQKPATPGERLFSAIEDSNWVALGAQNAPALYAFIDPQCPHCHEFMKDIRKDFLDRGHVQLRMIPVGFREDTKAQAAFLLASSDAPARWLRHLDGDKSALPATPGTNVQAAEMNLALMQEWKLDATPILVYRGADGTVKIVRGRPKNISDIINDLQR